jgi:hypothetical protein
MTAMRFLPQHLTMICFYETSPEFNRGEPTGVTRVMMQMPAGRAP